MLARNREIWDVLESIRHIEDRFNKWHHYDWVFLNDQPFDHRFKNMTGEAVSGSANYGTVPKDQWCFPDFIDQDVAAEARAAMGLQGVPYGESESYRHMCRYQSGLFFWHELMLRYDWYWRVEPGIEIYCDIQYDPFVLMAKEGKSYGFVISLYELPETISTLWKSARSFVEKYSQHVSADSSVAFLSDDGGATFNTCHFVRRL